MISTVLDHLWQSTLLALVAGLLAMAFRKARASVRSGLWFAASAKFLVPFAALTALGRLLAPAVRPPMHAAPDAVFIARATEPFSQSYGAAPVAHAIAHTAHAGIAVDPALALVGVWALGCAAILIFWMVRWAKVSSAARRATPLPWRAPMPVRASSSMLEPGLIGLWRPVLIVPETLPDHLVQPEIDALVAHEACHLRRRDNLTAAIHMLVEALFWFHPLVWWIGARLIEERERACDEAVVRSGHDRAAYAKSLVECCRLYLQSPLSCVAGASGSNLKQRVELIMTAPPCSPLSVPKKALLLTAGLCAIASPVAAGLLTSPAGQRAGGPTSPAAQKAAARSTAILSGSAPAAPDDAVPTSVATPAPADGGAAKTIVLAQDPSATAADTATASASSAQGAAGQAQPMQDKAANGAGQATAPTLVTAPKPAVVARATSQAPGGGPEDAVPGPLASLQVRPTSHEETSPNQLQPARGPDGPGPYLVASGMLKSGSCARWSPWYAVTTSPIAAGHSIRNFRGRPI